LTYKRTSSSAKENDGSYRTRYEVELFNTCDVKLASTSKIRTSSTKFTKCEITETISQTGGYENRPCTGIYMVYGVSCFSLAPITNSDNLFWYEQK
jgi:hypothetical protein